MGVRICHQFMVRRYDTAFTALLALSRSTDGVVLWSQLSHLKLKRSDGFLFCSESQQQLNPFEEPASDLSTQKVSTDKVLSGPGTTDDISGDGLLSGNAIQGKLI